MLGPFLITWTTIVRSLVCCCCCLSFGGWGTSAFRPFGVSGVMTMKMISSTSRTSISGVTLISAEGPPFPPPTFILIEASLLFSGGRRVLERSLFTLLGQKPKLVHTGRPHVIDDFYHSAVLGAGIRLYENLLVSLVG